MTRLAPVVLGTLLCLAAGAAAAQSKPAPQPAPAPGTDLDDRPGTLSDKLGGSGGVIKPTGDVDPAMHKAAPQTGAMPLVDPGHVPHQSGNGATGSGGLY